MRRLLKILALYFKYMDVIILLCKADAKSNGGVFMGTVGENQSKDGRKQY